MNAVEDFLQSLGDVSLEKSGIDAATEDAPLTTVKDPHEVNRAPLVFGHDGDDTGQRTRIKFRVDGNGDQDRLLAELAPSDMLQSGHGFLIRDVGTAPKTPWRTTCELCGTALAQPAAEGWICELGCIPGTQEWDQCGCNWCLLRGQWMRGEYRPRGGRPAKRCGTRECTTRAARERKRRQRERERALAALTRIDGVPEQSREAVRSKLQQPERDVTETPQQVEGSAPQSLRAAPAWRVSAANGDRPGLHSGRSDPFSPPAA